MFLPCQKSFTQFARDSTNGRTQGQRVYQGSIIIRQTDSGVFLHECSKARPPASIRPRNWFRQLKSIRVEAKVEKRWVLQYNKGAGHEAIAYRRKTSSGFTPRGGTKCKTSTLLHSNDSCSALDWALALLVRGEYRVVQKIRGTKVPGSIIRGYGRTRSKINISAPLN